MTSRLLVAVVVGILAAAAVVGAVALLEVGVERYGGTIEVRQSIGHVNVSEPVGRDGDVVRVEEPAAPTAPQPAGGGGGGGGGDEAPGGSTGGGTGGDGGSGGGGGGAVGCRPADGDGIVLAPGDAGTTVTRDGSGELAIDFDVASAGLGANVAAVYLVGDPDDQPAGEHAFSVTNRADEPVDLAVNYTAGSAAVVDGRRNVYVEVFAGDGRRLAASSEEGAAGTVAGLGVGEAVCATVTVDTRSLAPGDDLSGALNVTASPS